MLVRYMAILQERFRFGDGYSIELKTATYRAAARLRAR